MAIKTGVRQAPAAAGLIVAALLLVAFLAAPGATPLTGGQYYGCEDVQTQGSSQTSGAGGLMLHADVGQLSDEADLIVRGAVESFQTCRSTGPVTIVTLVRIAPAEFYKAEKLPEEPPLTIAVPGGAIDGYRLAVGTSPEFTVGEQVIAFLSVEEDEVYTPDGFQGKLTVTPGERIADPPVSLDEMRTAVTAAVSGDLADEDDPLDGGPQIEESDFATISSKFADSAIPIPYYINATAGKPAQLTAQQTRLAVINAFHSWQNLPDSYIAFGPMQNTSRTSTQGDCDGFHDTTWGISSSHGSTTLARTTTCYSIPSYNTLDADVEIDTDHYGGSWSVGGSGCSPLDLETVLLHENGHVLGLGHPSSNSGCQPCPVMDASYGGVNRTPCVDDEDGADYLYPRGGGSPPPAPGGFTASGDESALLTWANVAGEWGFEVWRASESCATASDPDFTLLDTAGDDTLSYTDTDYGNGLPAGNFCYRARSFNNNGESAFSSTSGVTIGSPPSSTATPTLSPSPSPTATSTPSPSATATPSASPTPQSPPPAPTNTPAPTVSPTETPDDAHVQGDVDCNDSVDTNDLIAILLILGSTGATPACAADADVNCDGQVNGLDAVLVLRYIVELGIEVAGCPPVGAATA